MLNSLGKESRKEYIKSFGYTNFINSSINDKNFLYIGNVPHVQFDTLFECQSYIDWALKKGNYSLEEIEVH